MKKFIFRICVIALALFTVVFVYRNIKIRTTEFSLLKSYTSSSYVTIKGTYPENTDEEISVNQQAMMIYQSSKGFYGLSGKAGNNNVYIMNDKMQIIEQMPLNCNALRLYEYNNFPLVICENPDKTYDFFEIDFENKKKTVLFKDFLPDATILAYSVEFDTIAVQDKEANIYVGTDENGMEKVFGKEDGFTLLGACEKNKILMFYEISDFFGIGAFVKYDIESQRTHFIRFVMLPTSRGIFDISADGKCLVVHKILRWDGIYAPVVYDIHFPAKVSFSTTEEDYPVVQFVK